MPAEGKNTCLLISSRIPLSSSRGTTDKHVKTYAQACANVRFQPENLLQEQDLGYRFLAALFNIFMLVMISIYSVTVHAG